SPANASPLSLPSFFFQAEDGIRDFHVTGVQTCALPIYRSGPGLMRATSQASLRNASEAWEQVLRQAGADAAGYGRQLFAVVDALDRSAGLRRALTEPTRDGEAKAALAAELLRGKVAEPVLDLVSGMAR